MAFRMAFFRAGAVVEALRGGGVIQPILACFLSKADTCPIAIATCPRDLELRRSRSATLEDSWYRLARYRVKLASVD